MNNVKTAACFTFFYSAPLQQWLIIIYSLLHLIYLDISASKCMYTHMTVFSQQQEELGDVALLFHRLLIRMVVSTLTSLLFCTVVHRCCSTLHQSDSETFLYVLIIFYSSQERQREASLHPVSSKQAAVRKPQSPDALHISVLTRTHLFTTPLLYLQKAPLSQFPFTT